MNLDDRLRRELQRQAGHIEGRALGPASIVTTAGRRTRRTRIVGAGLAACLVFGLGGLAVALRSPSSTSELQAGPAPQGASQVENSQPSAGTTDEPDPSDEALATTELDDTNPGESEAPSNPAETNEAVPPAPASWAPAQLGQISGSVEGIVGLAQLDAQERASAGTGMSIQTSGNAVELPDPRPAKTATIDFVASSPTTTVAAGHHRSNAAVTPWLAVWSDEGWVATRLPLPVEDSASNLVANVVELSAVSVEGDTIYLTGQERTDLRVDQLLDDDVLASGSWQFGTATGDMSTLTVFDEDGNVSETIDLPSLGVSAATIEAWERGTDQPYAVQIQPNSTERIDAGLGFGTILSDIIGSPRGLFGVGFDAALFEPVLWRKVDGEPWKATATGVLAHGTADTLGTTNDVIVAITAQGPILTVQFRADGPWQEVNLSDQLGVSASEYLVTAAEINDSGAALVIETVGVVERYWLASSLDGIAWTTAPLPAGTVAPTASVVDLAVTSAGVHLLVDQGGVRDVVGPLSGACASIATEAQTEAADEC